MDGVFGSLCSVLAVSQIEKEAMSPALMIDLMLRGASAVSGDMWPIR